MLGERREAKADRKESEKEKRMREAVRSMQDAMPGVQGRLADLGKVTQRRYNLALAMAMNKDMDAVVCDDEQVAKQCIQVTAPRLLCLLCLLRLLCLLCLGSPSAAYSPARADACASRGGGRSSSKTSASHR